MLSWIYFLFRFNPNNVLGIRSFADTLGCTQLAEAADKYIQRYFYEVSLSDEFLSINGGELLEIVKKDDLHVISEEEVKKTNYSTKSITLKITILNFDRFSKL